MRPRCRSAAVVATTLLITAGCGAPADRGSAPPPSATASAPESGGEPSGLTDVVRLDAATLALGALGPQQDRLAGSPGDFSLATTGAGGVEVVAGRDGGPALRFPEHQAQGVDRAILVAAPTRELDPDADFRLAVSFKLDPVSEGGDDNGNNLLQRGLFADPAQYKLQVDGGVVSCRIQGEAGELMVRTDASVLPGGWYDVTCDRVAGRLRLTVAGPGDPEVVEVEGSAGRLEFDPSTPITVGGKASPQGDPVVANSDQFNGLIDRVEFTSLAEPAR